MSNVDNYFDQPGSGSNNEFNIYGDVDVNGTVFTAAQHKECLIASGFYDYNDSATSENPISFSGGTPQLLTNDGQGQFSTNEYGILGIDHIYDASSNSFDFSSLNLGDVVGIRVDLSVTTVSNNQVIDLYMALGSGAGAYQIPWLSSFQFKTAEEHRIAHYSKIYMGNQDTIGNPAQSYILSPQAGSVTVNGWFVDVSYRRK